MRQNRSYVAVHAVGGFRQIFRFLKRVRAADTLENFEQFRNDPRVFIAVDEILVTVGRPHGFTASRCSCNVGKIVTHRSVTWRSIRPC